EREAAVLEELGSRHPQIPDLFAFFPLTISNNSSGKEEQFFYLVQEFIDGRTLEEELSIKGQFSESEAVEVLREILNVLKFVHENGSIHRDIKPSNIMRDKSGRLYLLDFGAVKQVAKGAGAIAGRSTGIYSQGYAPPEQMAGAQVYPSTDLYALAVTVITLLTGKDPGELYDSYSNGWQWRSYAQVSDTMAKVLDRMLLTTPNQRFHSAQDVLDALTFRPTLAVSPPLSSQPPLPQPVQTSNSPTGIPPVSTATINPPVSATPTHSQPLSRRPKFSTWEILGGAAFTGFEAGLLFIALKSFLGISGISIGLLGMIIGGLIFAQYRRFIEGKNLVIFAALTLALMLIPALRVGLQFPLVFVAGVLAAAAAIAVTALFRLIYLLLSRLMG
ncbi:MAG: serine/threonine-protein kinase, partial [Cyanobacteriota bacterium]